MTPRESASLTQAIHLIFEWVRHRRPGPGTLNWTVESSAQPLVIDLSFPEMAIEDDEARFVPHDERPFTLDGSTPPSFRPLDRARAMLEDIDSEFAWSRPDDHGLNLRLAIASTGKRDVEAKMNLIKDQIIREVSASDEEPA